MHHRTKRWLLADPIPPEIDLLLQNYHPVLRRMLYNRGCKTSEEASQYVEARQPSGTDPMNMLGMPEAVDRLNWAIQHGEPIAIYGDYDADGVTATALLVQAIKQLGGNVLGYIPNRFEEGYGLNNEALDNLRAQGISLVITVDCGIRSAPEAQHAREVGLDLVITDHHHPASEIPEAVSVINPKQPGDGYPEKDLAGVGLAYKLASALFTNRGRPRSEEESYLDLVAIGTVADLAPLTGENRALVRKGLEHIRRPQRQGVMSLIGVSGLKAHRVTATDIGFVLGPRLNAAGRLESALAALELLTSSSPGVTGPLAQQLDNQNRERQRITQEIQTHAEQLALGAKPDAYLLFACHESYNPGVVGLAASRLAESYYRPSIVAHRGERLTRGSCRSISEFHITQALDECADLLEHYGGHAAAAGFTVRNENLDLLMERLESLAVQQLSHLDLRPLLKADMEISLSDLRPDLLGLFEYLQPTGYHNPQAYFVSRDLKVVSSRTVGRDNTHLKIKVTNGWITFDGIAFNMGYWQPEMPARVDILYTFELNEYNGHTSLQLRVRDLKPAGTPD